ncbi:sodium-dependent transporter [Ekhidna sp.]|jgi:NSS family neurotransmitter:Na+ symporter|uniref:sodium-dependent transporter n=1 Tax=Ekhidna sp. TaxID=2608089 RepID=UPI0032EDD51F
MSKEQFSNRWGIVLAALGMAIGAGNLWRFPRLAGQYGGSFILLWILFLFIWSIPLLLSEFAIGKKFKSGVIGSFAQFAGKKYTWMGFFITICTLGIAFYYSIVTAWSFRYLTFSLGNLFKDATLQESLQANPDYLANFWNGISNGDWITVIVYICVIFLAAFILIRGVKNGLEKANKLLIPSLFILLIIIVIVSLNMEGGVRGLEYMFAIDWTLFSNPTIWIEALSQSAWSTGAGWGLMMTLSAFSRDNEDVTLNTFIGAFGNNTASLLSGMAILPAVFALAASDAEAISYLQTGNQALTFTIIPMLFANIPGGDYLSALFFLALFVAAFSSLLPMIELFLQNVADLNISKRKTLVVVIVCFIAFGFPSAWSINYFSNQDWVWGVGLIVTGLFILIGVAMNSPEKFKESTIDVGSDMILPSGFFKFAIFSNIAVGFFLIYWWLSQDYSSTWFNEEGQWDLFGVYSNASTITQWGIVIIAGLILNGYLYKKFVKQ